ncbi:hypothetical protein [Enterococcus faecalis]|uniref:hypothetical protein n=1 Tax=Enterococcus TaxID=1350 RepID=UPI00070FC9F4|nr:hypothetical protein [Enterococcus faecalis]KXF71670.1 hypothetical protein AQ486_03550 [Enterococcus faecalis]KXF73971.1 hypothetical protein AQ487_03900 [Enterococcus faecalis]MBC2812582.1 hypothetical protein [Enterococcus faecalis]MBC2816482.1 hypothetical protein [Enterococcus faecalis]MBC2819499.1 hypothetical protein [Enterococcus faecalis]
MLNVKYSKIFSYVLFYDKEKVYLVDTKYTNSLFNLPKPPEKVILKAYYLEPYQVSNFEISNSKSMSTLTAILITQPFVTLIYNIGKYLFQGFEEKYYVVIKVLLLFIVLAITIISNQIYLKSLKKKISSNLLQESNTFYLKVYKTKKIQKKFMNYFVDILGYMIGIMILGIPLYLYFIINDGAESILLIVISGIFFVIYGSTKISPIAAPVIKNYGFVIKDSDK